LSLEIREHLQTKYNISTKDYIWIEQMVIEKTPHKAGMEKVQT